MNFNVYAIPRSGHTAIINYIALQDTIINKPPSEGTVEHNENGGYSAHKTRYTLMVTPHSQDRVPKKLKDLLTEYNDRQIIVDNQSLKYSLLFKGKQNYINGEFKQVIILRNIYNNISSIIQQRKYNKNRLINEGKEFIESWKSHAREFLGKTSYINKPRFILYNNWFYSKEYRRKVVKNLGLTFTDQGMDYLPHNGSGSSFDGMSNDIDPSGMKVLDRWKNMLDEGIFFELLDDKELIRLNNQIFPRPNIEQFQKYYPWFYRLYSKYWKKYD